MTARHLKTPLAADFQDRGSDQTDERAHDVHLVSSEPVDGGFLNAMMCWRGNPSTTRSNREALRLDLDARVVDAHPMRRGDRNSGIFLAVFHQDQSPICFERPPDASKHLLWVRELVVDVDEQRKVNGVVRQGHVRVCPLHDLDVRQPLKRPPSP